MKKEEEQKVEVTSIRCLECGQEAVLSANDVMFHYGFNYFCHDKDCEDEYASKQQPPTSTPKMKHTTTDGKVYYDLPNCDCDSTGGCEKCSPSFFRYRNTESFIGMLSDGEADEMRKKVSDWKKRFNKSFEERNKRLFPPLNPLKL